MANGAERYSDKSVRQFFRILSAYIHSEKAGNLQYEDTFPQLYHLAGIHGLKPVLYYMLRDRKEELAARYPEQMERLEKAYLLSVGRSMQQDAARREIQKVFREDHIRPLFFKGAQIRSFYPVPELRTMGDLDFLIRDAERERAHELMLQLGYQFFKDEGDVWKYRRGVVEMEMHIRVASNSIGNGVDYRRFFRDASDQWNEEEDGFYLEPEYHFVFLIYHLAKHLNSTGAGIRMFLDPVVFLMHYGKDFDMEKAECMLKEISLEKTAAAACALCNRWFGSSLPIKEEIQKKVLDELEVYVIQGGTFGFETHDITDMYKRRACTVRNGKAVSQTRFRLMMECIFPPASHMRFFLPAVQEHKWLLPAAWVKRWCTGIFRKRKKSLTTLKNVMRSDAGRSMREKTMLKGIGL